MQTNPLVAIIIPCYNQSGFLAEAVASVVEQTFDRWEIIVVNDGSSDDTSIQARRLIARLPERRITLIDQVNAGTGASRNRGIAASSAPFVLPLDADDILMPTLLERTVPLLERDCGLGFVTTNVRFFGAEHSLWSGGEPSAGRLIYDCRMVVTSLFRRTAWQQVAGFSEDRSLASYEDWDFWLRLVSGGWRGQLLPETLVCARRAAAGRLRQAQANDLRLRAELMQAHAPLYPAAFQPWAAGVLRATARAPLGGATWWRWFIPYALLIARHTPQELPKTLLRPFFTSLAPQHQTYARRLARVLRLSRAR